MNGNFLHWNLANAKSCIHFANTLATLDPASLCAGTQASVQGPEREGDGDVDGGDGPVARRRCVDVRERRSGVNSGGGVPRFAQRCFQSQGHMHLNKHQKTRYIKILELVTNEEMVGGSRRK